MHIKKSVNFFLVFGFGLIVGLTIAKFPHSDGNPSKMVKKSVNGSLNAKIDNNNESLNLTRNKFYEIPFYYDHTQSPKNIKKDQILSYVKEASKIWESTCNIKFTYQGEINSDYIPSDGLLEGGVGVIRWTSDLDYESYAQASKGDNNSPAYGFILDLNNKIFNKEKERAYIKPTIVHELGHVIGLGHSRNPNSIMDYDSRNEKKYKPNHSDKLMCDLLVSSWNNINYNSISSEKILYVDN